ncbi:MAG: bifunctional serine/threonine-protein kinase/formylglycine-generating enzyme family protein [Planctomycetota bacterium]
MAQDTDLRFALAATQLGIISRKQLLSCVGTWLEELRRVDGAKGKKAKRPETLLYEAGLIDETGLTTVLKAMKRGAAGIDEGLRNSLLNLSPPKPISDWLKSLPVSARGQTMIKRAPKDIRYDLGKEIARGGVGRVVEGIDRKLRREVALKLLPETADPESVERFVREARISAKLDHPNVVPVYDFGDMPGVQGGRQLYLAMKRVKGKDLGEILMDLATGQPGAEDEWTQARLLGIFQDVCQGIAYAHSRGVLHRDLKPANVMLGDYGEVLIVDWGLAKFIGEAEPERSEPSSAIPMPLADLTMVGQIVGTPSYMSPEAAAGHADSMDERSDVYALGTILYAILTWRVPFEGVSRDDVINKVKEFRFVPPGKRVAETKGPRPGSVAPELEAVCVKAMARYAAERHASARELYDAVRQFLEGASEHERHVHEAAGHVDRGRGLLTRCDELEAQIRELEMRSAEFSGHIKPHQPPVEKRPLWDAEAKLRELRDEKVEKRAQAAAEFREALRLDPGNTEAQSGICSQLVERYLEAERRGDRAGMLHVWNSFQGYDKGGEWRYLLDAPGRLELRTWVYACQCLRPATGAFGIEFVETASVPWREGKPRPDLAVTPEDLPVPAIWSVGAAAKHGHTAACHKVERKGVEVWVAKIKEADRRLTPREERFLGKTPLGPIELPQGDYQCFLRAQGTPEVRLPVRITRDGLWKQDVTLYAPSEVPDGFVLMPGGPFVKGRGVEEGGELPTADTADAFVAQFPVTCADYLEYLNDLCAKGLAADAERRRPKEAERRFWVLEGEGANARFRLPTAEEDPELAWEPGWPVLGVTWRDAIGYCEWRSAREGRTYRLLHEDEYEKAARGVDQRAYSFGRSYDGTYSHTNVSLTGPARPMPAGSFAADESVYGVRDLSGGASTWCLNLFDPALPRVRAVRGGSWGASPAQAHAAVRQSLHPASASLLVGFRLACSAEAWP